MKLSKANLGHVNAQHIPTSQVLDAGVGIVHLGFGAFHRAHQALITDTVMKELGGNWKIVGVSWGSREMQEALAPQDFLYTVGVGYNQTLNTHVIGAIDKILVSAEHEQVLDYMCRPEIKIVSLTVTEKGYCHSPSTGDIDLSNPLIAHDLNNLASPKSAIGFIVSALYQRREKNIPPFTPLSCDNLPENGHVLEKVVHQFAKAYDESLYSWIKENVRFPCTMVDRIVPRTTDNDLQRVSESLGAEDKAAVVTEPFLQWAIEDKFVNDRPQWEKTSIPHIQVVEDVVPFEDMKLRLLNGTHSAMAYLGYLSGYETIAETIQDTQFKTYIRYLMDVEITPSVAIQNVDLEEYKSLLIDRYTNTALQHRTYQIAMDGSQKIPQRWLNTIQYNIDNGAVPEGLYLALAAWIRYVKGVDEHGNSYIVQDPLVETYEKLWRENAEDPRALIQAFLAIDKIFSPAFAQQDCIATAVEKQLINITTNGAKQCVADFVATLS